MVIPLTDVRFRIALLMSGFCSAVGALYVAAGAEPHTFVTTTLMFGPGACVLLWLQKDAYTSHVGAVLDVGFLAGMWWPIVLPWYAFKSRGSAGWKLLAALVVIIVAPDATMRVVYWLITRGQG